MYEQRKSREARRLAARPAHPSPTSASTACRACSSAKPRLFHTSRNSTGSMPAHRDQPPIPPATPSPIASSAAIVGAWCAGAA